MLITTAAGWLQEAEIEEEYFSLSLIIPYLINRVKSISKVERSDLKDHEKNVLLPLLQASASTHRENTISAHAASPHKGRVFMETLAACFPHSKLDAPTGREETITIIHKVTLY